VHRRRPELRAGLHGHHFGLPPVETPAHAEIAVGGVQVPLRRSGSPSSRTAGRDVARASPAGSGNIVTIAGEVSSIVDAVNTTSQSGIWIGAAGDTFRSKIGELPTNARKCADSYGIARDAAAVWAGKIDDAQARADSALAQARVAHGDLAAARDALSQALNSQLASARSLEPTQNLYGSKEASARACTSGAECRVTIRRSKCVRERVMCPTASRRLSKAMSRRS